jgi:CMP-N-acetylneuraminic acid synthetase
MTVGIVAAKDHSKRFPNKNKYILDGEPLFWHSVKPLLNARKVDEVFVATDSAFISSYCKDRDINVIWRNRNAAHDEDPLLNILRFAYYNLDQEYDIIVTIMANCPGHSSETVDRAITLMQNDDFKEIRSFNANGEESGLMLFRKEVITQYTQISSHIGEVRSDVKEIHYVEDLNVRST